MKKHILRNRPGSWGRHILSLLLVLSILFSLPIPGFAAEEVVSNTPAADNPPNASAQEISGDNESASGGTQTQDVSGTDSSSEEDSQPGSSVEPDSDAAPAPAPGTFAAHSAASLSASEKFTVAYDMGIQDAAGNPVLETEEVEHGSLPQSVPVPAKDTYRFLQWENAQGIAVTPETTPVTAPVTYYAKFSRVLADLLNTTDHVAYVTGYTNGLFLPNQGITRAEVAKLFYELLRIPAPTSNHYSDVGSSWYTNAVSAMSGLGIVQGYTDGTFRPNRKITREEFIKMAVGFDNLDPNATASFSDVDFNGWSGPYIATAASKGWITGYGGNILRPKESITRAEAVTIINRMLGRIPNEAIKSYTDVKSFYDLYPSHWTYINVMEAAVAHQYTSNGLQETWTDYERNTSKTSGHWISYDGKSLFVDPATQKLASGDLTIGGKQYYFDPTNRSAYTGFRYVSGYKRYYKDGLLIEDISTLGVVSGPYYIKVYKPANYLIVFAKDGNRGYTIPVKSMLVSCGNNTPTGTFYTPSKYRWLKMVGDSWAQWCTQISGNYLFHSVPNWTYNHRDLEVHEYNQLGTTRSLGCIRLDCQNAKWIYDNCKVGTQVYISSYESTGVLAKPTALQIPAWHTWDPTDPTAYYLCRQRGCH